MINLQADDLESLVAQMGVPHADVVGNQGAMSVPSQGVTVNLDGRIVPDGRILPQHSVVPQNEVVPQHTVHQVQQSQLSRVQVQRLVNGIVVDVNGVPPPPPLPPLDPSRPPAQGPPSAVNEFSPVAPLLPSHHEVASVLPYSLDGSVGDVVSATKADLVNGDVQLPL